MGNFAEDLEKGKEAEKQFAQYLAGCPDMVSIEIAQGKFKDWDIKMTTPKKTITYEVKNDLQAHKTGNVAMEYKYKGKASGVYASKADVIVYHAAGRWFLENRGELILKLESAKKKIIDGGDGNMSGLYLLKMEEFEKIFREFDLSINEYDND